MFQVSGFYFKLMTGVRVQVKDVQALGFSL